MIPIKGSTLFLADNDSNFLKVTEKWGKTHEIQAVIGTNPNLKYLEKNQSVVWGDGSNYHFRLTKK